MSIKNKEIEHLNEPLQVKKNTRDIKEIKDNLQPYITAGNNIQVEYNTDYTSCVVSATLETAIDSVLSSTSTNPLQNKAIYTIVNDINISLDNINSAINLLTIKANQLETNKQDKFTIGQQLAWSGSELRCTALNTYSLPIFNNGLKVSTSNDNDSNKDIYIPYATETQVGVVNKQILTPIVISTIQAILPQIAPIFFPKAGEIIQTINATYNPNNQYQQTTWRKFKDGIYFSSGSIIEHRGEQLPNITGEIDNINSRGSSSNAITKSGAFKKTIKSNGNNIGCGTPYGDVMKTIIFNASDSNSIYTNNGKVRPNTFTTYSWIRVDGLSQEIMATLEPYLQA